MASKSVKVLALGVIVTSVGCNDTRGTQTTGSNPSPQTEHGTSTVSFAIPLHKPGSQFTAGPQSSKFGARAASARPRAQFIDSSANGNFVIFLDGTQLLSANFTPQWNSDGTVKTGSGPSAPSKTTPDGGSISYTSNVTSTEVDVTLDLTTVAGISHTLGVVQENGACAADQYGSQLCLGDPANTNGQPGINNGYVLAEGQTSPFILNQGDATKNTPVSLTLKGVLEAGFLCDAECDGQAGNPDSDGVYHLTAYPVDENGNAVTYPVDANGNSTNTYSNGWWDIEEMDNQNLVTIKTENPQPFNAPNLDQAGWDAQPFTFTCNATGDTTIAMRLLKTNPEKGPVSEFPYSKANYPQPGDVLGAVGSDLYFGNQLTVHCKTFGSSTFTVN